MPEGRDLAEAMAARDVRAERDDVAEIAAQLEAAADAGVGFATRTGQGGFTGGSQMYDMGMDPTFANTGGWGVPQNTVMNPFAAPVVAAGAGFDIYNNAGNQFADYVLDKTGLNKTEFEGYPNQQGITAPFAGYPNQQGITEPSNIDRVLAMRAEQQALNDRIEREIAAVEELNRVNRLSVQASDVTQPYPSSWSQPDEWGMENVRIGGPAMAESQLGAPRSPLGPDTARSAFPSPLTSVADYPAGDDWGMQDIRLDPLNPSPLTSVADYPGGDDWGMPNVGLTQASIAEGVMGAPGTYSGTVNPYDRARDASLAFDEYDRPSRQQQEILSRPDEWGMEAYSPGSVGPQFDSTMNVGAGSFPEDIEDEWGMSDVRLGQETEEMAWRTVNDPDVDDYIEGKITAEQLSKINSEAKLEEFVTEATKTLSKRLTKEKKEANVAVRRAKEKEYVDFRDTLNFRVEIARSALATAENTHGKKSPEAKAAKRNVRNKEADLRMWERSDIYSKSYGKVNRSGMGQGLPFVGTALKGLNSIEDYFHSLGKTERRSPQDLLDHMKANPEQYEKSSAEVSNAQLVRNIYPFLRKAPIDVAAAAAREPAYLRYLINLNVNKKPIPTSYSSNWKNDISDAWIYG